MEGMTGLQLLDGAVRSERCRNAHVGKIVMNRFGIDFATQLGVGQ